MLSERFRSVVIDYLDEMELLSIAHPNLGDTERRETAHAILQALYIEGCETAPANPLVSATESDAIAHDLTVDFANQLMDILLDEGTLSGDARTRLLAAAEEEVESSSRDSMLDDWVQGWAVDD